MTLLSPAPALIAAILAVPALLLLYFLKLRRRPLRVSSTLLWEQAIRDLQVNVPFRMLRITFLLVLQLLILALFLLALARPALNAAGEGAPRVVLLIDRSASMTARDAPGGTTRLEAAKRAAGAYLSELSRRAAPPALAVVAFAAQPEALTGLSPDLGAARAAIDGIAPTDQPGDLAAALRLASAMVAGDTDEGAGRTRALVVLFGDGSFAGDDAYALAGAEFRFQRVGHDDDRLDNLGLVALAARRDWDDPATIRVFARILNASATEVAAPIVLALDGREVERRAIIIPGRGAGAPPPPGEAALTLSLSTREGGVAELRIERPDLLDADNHAALVIAPATKPRIMLVVPDAAPAPEGRPDRGPEWILRDLIDEMALPVRVRTASAYAATASADLNADLIIFDRVRPEAAPPVASISFGAGLPLPGLEAGAAMDEGTYVISWDRSSPTLRHVALDTLYIARPLSLATPAPGSGITELARAASGPLMLLSRQAGAPHLVVGFEPAQSNWPFQVGFPIFIAAAIDELTLRAEELAGRFFTTDQTVRLEGLDGRVTLDGPRRVTVEAPRGAPAANFGRLEAAGVYRVSTSAGPGGAVAVNLLDPTESALAVRDTLRVAGQDIGAMGPDQGPRELWPLLVICALVLLSLEWFLNAWLMRV